MKRTRPVSATLPKPVRWFVISLFLGLICWGWFYFALARPVGLGPAGPAIPAQPFAQPWTSQPVVLLGLGDSITAGFGARKGYAYFERLTQNPPDDPPGMAGLNLRQVIPGLQTRILAVSGSTSIDCLERQLPRLPVLAKDVFGLVVLTTGGNDLIHHYGRLPPREGAMYGATRAQSAPWITNFSHRLDQVLLRLQVAFPGGCHVFIATIYDPTDGSGDLEHAGLGLPPWPDAADIHRSYNEVIRRFARRHPNVSLVDLHEAFLGHGLHCTQPWHPHYHPEDPHYWYYENLEDPNERGYDAIRRLFLREISRNGWPPTAWQDSPPARKATPTDAPRREPANR